MDRNDASQAEQMCIWTCPDGSGGTCGDGEGRDHDEEEADEWVLDRFEQEDVGEVKACVKSQR